LTRAIPGLIKKNAKVKNNHGILPNPSDLSDTNFSNDAKAIKAVPDAQQISKVAASVAEVTARTGETVKHAPRAPEFGDKYEFLEGATAASAQIQLDEIDNDDCKFGICLTAPIEVIIPKYNFPHRYSVIMSVSIWHPATKSWVELRPFEVVDTLSIALPPQIPHKQETLDLFDDFVDERALLVRVLGLDSGTFYGFQRNKFQAQPLPNANAKCQSKVPDLLIHPKETPSFEDVLSAVKSANQEWNAAATTLPIMPVKKTEKGIPLKKARAIFGRFVGTVRSFDKSMENRPKDLSAKEYWRQRMIANQLHGGAGPIAQKALADGVSGYEIHCCIAIHLFRSGKLSEAKSYAQKAFQLDPGSELAYLILKDIASLEQQEVDVDTSKLDAQELAEMEERWAYVLGNGRAKQRVLPWKSALPIYETIRKLEWEIPEDVPFHGSF
jgi:hypothetical protein